MVIQLPQSIDVQRSPRFMVNSQELGDLIAGLTLSVEQNDALIRLIIKQINESEATAFKQGFSIGAKVVEEYQQ